MPKRPLFSPHAAQRCPLPPSPAGVLANLQGWSPEPPGTTDNKESREGESATGWCAGSLPQQLWWRLGRGCSQQGAMAGVRRCRSFKVGPQHQLSFHPASEIHHGRDVTSPAPLSCSPVFLPAPVMGFAAERAALLPAVLLDLHRGQLGTGSVTDPAGMGRRGGIGWEMFPLLGFALPPVLVPKQGQAPALVLLLVLVTMQEHAGLLQEITLTPQCWMFGSCSSDPMICSGKSGFRDKRPWAALCSEG